jgi:hypothetical protein
VRQDTPTARSTEEWSGRHVDPRRLVVTIACTVVLTATAHGQETFQEGSGTAWLPAATRVAGLRAEPRGDWEFMFHYNAFAGVMAQEPEVGSTEGFTANWVMGMALYENKGSLLLRGMLSFEAPFLGDDGYPLLMQTGETAGGLPLVDRQHPHDLFMELAVKYDLPIGGGTTFEAYGAAAGEPALGPTAFPHRPSAETNPVAPLGHHWLDSTHISFGVLTAGVFWNRVKVEASAFNGREPDEDRYNFDFGPLDSYAARVAFNPSRTWTFQLSGGHLEEPEALEPGANVRRLTASTTHVSDDASWASTLAWGLNDPDDAGTSSAVLLESSWTTGPHAVFGRAEYVQKKGHDFGLTGPGAELRLPVGQIGAGYSYRVASIAGMEIAVGGEGMVGFVDDALETRYGTSTPVSAVVFFQLRPSASQAHAHGHQ